MTANPKKLGRPPVKASIDDPAAIKLLCERLAEGKGMKEACSDDGCPSDTAVYRRLAVDEDFAAVIARARAAQQEAEIEKMIELADSATPETWQVVRLQIWARQWRTAKLSPKKYGDKSQDVNIEVTVLTPEQRVARIRELAAKAVGTLLDARMQIDGVARVDGAD